MLANKIMGIELLLTLSPRPEVANMRKKNAGKAKVVAPGLHDGQYSVSPIE